MKSTLQFLCISFLLSVLLIIPKQSEACYSYFTHTNACAGDTVWFAALDHYAVYAWSYGDTTFGTSNYSFDSVGYHVYNSPGTYFVTLFTNIGAEWDYYTTLITIGTSCFDAAFSSACNGSNYVSFTDASIGNITYWHWTFGDPSSGVADTSLLQNPYHIYPASGTYNVSLIVSDGTQWDTINQTVTSYDNCIGASFYYSGMYMNCVNDTFYPPVTYSGAITSYLWNFGDPSSGASNTSNLSAPFHIYTAPGNYIVSVTISDGIITTTSYYYATLIDCRCWPGDGNRNGVCDGDDLFPIGIYYSHTGTPRTSANNSWTGQNATDWPNFFNDAMYLQDFLNMKYADANGDGTIDSLDVTVTLNNCGLHHNIQSKNSSNLFADSNDAQITFQPTSTSASNGVWVDVPVYLSSLNDTVRNVYGLSMVIDVDDSFLDSAYVTFNSWLSNSGNDLLSFCKYIPTTHQIIASQCRKNSLQVSGNGQVAVLHLRFANAPNNGTCHLSFNQNSKLITNGMYPTQTNLQKVLPLYFANELSLDLNPASTGNQISTEINLRIMPNPAKGMLNIYWDNGLVNSFDVIDMLGRTLIHTDNYYNPLTMQPVGNPAIDISNLPNGEYILKATTEKGVGTLMFVIN